MCYQVAATQVDGYDSEPNYEAEYARKLEELEAGAERNSSNHPSRQDVDAASMLDEPLAAITVADIEQLIAAWFHYSQTNCADCAAWLDYWLETFVLALVDQISKLS